MFNISHFDTMMLSRLGFVGGGKITSALVAGLIRSGDFKPQNILVSEPCPKAREQLQQKLNVQTCADNKLIPAKCDTILIAVKPDIVPGVLDELSPSILKQEHVVISVAAGVKISTIEQHLPEETSVVRSMPNTSSQIGSGATLFAPGLAICSEQIEYIHELFSSVGYCQKVDEKYLDVITGLSGCGPCYMYIVCEALADGGVKAGLPKELAVKLVAQTMLGASRMMLTSDKHISQTST
ncbi:hypothetical protein LOD99_4562 [Oopsacas minuta]|uniref:Pyrroline-5-carboxylate reductase 3 n=1 Tax=Oopsacas minuta TaxID=111878 RepID=A0AAV7JTE0_9METZ|nr:hypothetical protein LOD99_4562 [Oopsacas minuta]